LNLAFDLRYASDHFPGIGVYAQALATALLEREAFASVTLLWDPGASNTRFDLEPLRRHPRARWHELDVPAMSLNTARETGRALSRLDVDAYLSPFWLRPEATDVPCMLTVHDVLPLAMPSLMSWPRRCAFTWAMRRASGAAAVLTVSRFSRDEILRLTPIGPERLHVLNSGVWAPAVTPRRPAGVPERAFALTVASNRPHKGLGMLAEVWRSFAGNAPLEWVAAGARVAGRHSLAPRVQDVPGVSALGHVTQAELEWLYQNATLVLVPSSYEGFGLPLLEGAARGVAVVAADIPALRETGDGVGRFEPAGDATAWARAIRELAADELARRRMGERGRVRAAEYDFSRHGAFLESLFHDILAGART
jgi:alpha-1,3-rhamnosyl/mannosyltransferase